jgi:hypothetical protein
MRSRVLGVMPDDMRIVMLFQKLKGQPHMYGTGLLGTRLAIVKALAPGDRMSAEGYARTRWGEASDVVRHLKAAVAGSEAATLHAADAGIDFRAAASALSLPGMLGLRRISPHMPMLTQLEPSTAQWVRHGGAIKLHAGTFTRDPGLTLKKINSLFVASKEAVEDAGAEEGIREGILTGFAKAMNLAFVNPDNAGDADMPASITCDATPIDAGSTIEDLDDALRQALQMLGSIVNARDVRVIMSAVLAGCLSLARGSGGAPAYPALSAMGGMLAGLNVLTFDGGENASSSDGEFIALVDGGAIAYSDEAPEIAISSDAVIEMDNAPTGNTITPTAASANLVSMWQEEAVCFRGTWRANWKLRRPDAVQLIAGVPFKPAAS